VADQIEHRIVDLHLFMVSGLQTVTAGADEIGNAQLGGPNERLIYGGRAHRTEADSMDSEGE
jgi:hypothetical protein